jgi:hypothetical protein
MGTRVLQGALLAATALAALAGGAPMPARANEGTAMTNAPATLLAAALDDAVRRTGASRAAINVVLVAPVTWPDGSIGCPEPGKTYLQALVPGYRIVLRAGTATLNYHAREQGPPLFCPADRIVTPLPAADDPSV